MALNKKKKLVGKIKLQIPAGKATPAPPIGPALGQHGVGIMDFCKAYNDATKDKAGFLIPVEIYVYADRSFDFSLKTISEFELEIISKSSLCLTKPCLGMLYVLPL